MQPLSKIFSVAATNVEIACNLSFHTHYFMHRCFLSVFFRQWYLVYDWVDTSVQVLHFYQNSDTLLPSKSTFWGKMSNVHYRTPGAVAHCNIVSESMWEREREHVHVCVCTRMGVCSLVQPISCRKDVVNRVQQLHAGNSSSSIVLSSITFFFFFCHGEVCSVCLCEPKPPVFLTASFVEVNMFPRVILRGTMIKKSQQKKRTSPCNYKERFFVLDTQNLKYSERRPGVSVLCLIG